MPLAERTATATWNGTLMDGSGTLSLPAVGDTFPISWRIRTGEAPGTSPEELLAGAQAACYAMALSGSLARAETPADNLEVTAVCTFDRVDGKAAITTMRITVRGQVPGIDASTFESIAREAEKGCPVANAIRGNVDIAVEASLAA
jgi:osmotically inducible protein OsmC